MSAAVFDFSAGALAMGAWVMWADGHRGMALWCAFLVGANIACALVSS